MSASYAVTPSAGPGPEPICGTLAESLLSLLERADGDLASAPCAVSARQAVRHAASILRAELDRQAPCFERPGNVGELAAWQINRVARYIDSHISERIRLENLSAIARRSPAYFSRAFKRTLGETPQSFVTSRRLIHAQHLMLSSRQSLSEIAIACGFSDQAHFCNRFRQANGVSPAVWRRERCEIPARQVRRSGPEAPCTTAP